MQRQLAIIRASLRELFTALYNIFKYILTSENKISAMMGLVYLISIGKLRKNIADHKANRASFTSMRVLHRLGRFDNVEDSGLTKPVINAGIKALALNGMATEQNVDLVYKLYSEYYSTHGLTLLDLAQANCLNKPNLLTLVEKLPTNKDISNITRIKQNYPQMILALLVKHTLLNQRRFKLVLNHENAKDLFFGLLGLPNKYWQPNTIDALLYSNNVEVSTSIIKQQAYVTTADVEAHRYFDLQGAKAVGANERLAQWSSDRKNIASSAQTLCMASRYYTPNLFHKLPDEILVEIAANTVTQNTPAKLAELTALQNFKGPRARR